MDVSPIPVVLKIISLNWEDVIVYGIIVGKKESDWKKLNWKDTRDSGTKNLKLNGFLNWQNDV